MAELPGKKNKLKWIVMAKFIDPDDGCEICLKDLFEIAEQQGIDTTPEADGRFQCPVKVYDYHFHKGCPHDGPHKGQKLVKSAYV